MTTQVVQASLNIPVHVRWRSHDVTWYIYKVTASRGIYKVMTPRDIYSLNPVNVRPVHDRFVFVNEPLWQRYAMFGVNKKPTGIGRNWRYPPSHRQRRYIRSVQARLLQSTRSRVVYFKMRSVFDQSSRLFFSPAHAQEVLCCWHSFHVEFCLKAQFLLSDSSADI